MENIEDVIVKPLVNAKFVKPYLICYSQANVRKEWEVISVHPSVCILIFNVERKKLVFVRQFRPAVYFSNYPRDERELIVNTVHRNPEDDITIESKVEKKLPKIPGHLGMTLELCAGIVDKNKPWKEIARDEVLEEVGYKVSAEMLEEVISYRSGVGATGDKQTLFYVEVTDEMKVSQGGGLASEGEVIEVIELSISEVRALLSQKELLVPSGFLFAISWFLTNKGPLYE